MIRLKLIISDIMKVKRMNRKKQKDQRWALLIHLLNKDPGWFQKPETALYAQITHLGREITEQEKRKKLPQIDEAKFLVLVGYGYTLKQIAVEFNVSKRSLHNWRVEKGYIKRKKQEEVK